MKKLRIIIIFLFFFAFCFINAEASEINEEIKEELNTEILAESLDSDTESYLEMAGINTENALSPDYGKISEVLIFISEGILPQVIEKFTFMSVLCIFASLITSFEIENSIADFAVTVIAALMLYPSVINITESVRNAVTTLSVFIKSAIPLYSGVLIFSGKTATGKAYSVLTLFAAEFTDFIVTSLALPLIPIMLSLCLTSVFTGKSFDKINDKIQKLVKWVLVITVTVFSSVTSLQTAVTGNTDALTMKGARLMVSTAIPIVGSALGDALNAVNGSLAVIKSGAGAFGILAIIFIFAPVIINVTVNMLSLFGLSVICELFEMKKLNLLISGCMSLYKLLIACAFTMMAVALISSAILITVIK